MMQLCDVVTVSSDWQETYTKFCADQKVISLDLLVQL